MQEQNAELKPEKLMETKSKNPYEEIQKINVRVSMLMTDLEDIQEELDELQDLLEIQKKQEDLANFKLQKAKHVETKPCMTQESKFEIIKASEQYAKDILNKDGEFIVTWDPNKFLK